MRRCDGVLTLAGAHVLLLGLAACGGSDEAGPDSPDALRDLTYQSSWVQSGSVTLSDGEYREATAPGAASEVVVRLTDKQAVGAVGGQLVGAAVLVSDPGGSGTFYDLALLGFGPEGWENVDTELLGDRIEVHSVAIADDRIVLELTTHAPGDPMCCPTRQETRRFAVDGGRLRLVSEEGPAAAPETIVGIVWKWQETLFNDDTRTAPPQPEHYTLTLQRDGNIAVRADCNRGGGVYLVDGSQISIEVTHTTRAMCPPESLDTVFLRDLNRAAIFVLEAGHLYIDLEYHTGTMKFGGRTKIQ